MNSHGSCRKAFFALVAFIMWFSETRHKKPRMHLKERGWGILNKMNSTTIPTRRVAERTKLEVTLFMHSAFGLYTARAMEAIDFPPEFNLWWRQLSTTEGFVDEQLLFVLLSSISSVSSRFYTIDVDSTNSRSAKINPVMAFFGASESGSNKSQMVGKTSSALRDALVHVGLNSDIVSSGIFSPAAMYNLLKANGGFGGSFLDDADGAIALLDSKNSNGSTSRASENLRAHMKNILVGGNFMTLTHFGQFIYCEQVSLQRGACNHLLCFKSAFLN
jgi:hypothetical protein